MGRPRIFSDEERVQRAKDFKKRWADEHSEKIRAATAKWREKNPNYLKIWAEKNPEKAKELSSKKSTSMGYLNCPVCSCWGQLKRRVKGTGYVFYQVDHYTYPNNNVITKKYERNCHIKKALAISLGFTDVGRGMK